jgi:hypothetical protein
VSSSCTTIYVDGSESRGALSAAIDVAYGSLVGEARLRVWVPQGRTEIIKIETGSNGMLKSE